MDSLVWWEKGSPGYPARLNELDRAPVEVWVAGAWSPTVNAVAIVGSRAASRAAVDFAKAAARAAAKAGWDVISGGAFGVDAAAHTAALDAGGQTVAVLGCGVDVTYPERHASLYDRIRARGAVMSELPLGAQPLSRHFPPRNRIIAALSDIIVVVEASATSGALHTASAARRLGRRLRVRPGSPGCDVLLRLGAEPLVDPAEILSAAPTGPTLTGPALAIHSALLRAPGRLDELAAHAGLSVGECAELLFELESCGKAFRTSSGLYQAHG